MTKLTKRVMLAFFGFLLIGCASTPSGGKARVTEAGEYEIHNPTFCVAKVFIWSDDGVNRREIAEVPSGSRSVISVPRRSHGHRLGARATEADGRDCERTQRVTIRRVTPAAPTTRSAPVAPAVTTIVVVRHAEKSTDDPRDPSLSATGQERASALSTLLKDAGVGGIYTTQYKRTRQTAEPLARQLGIPITERPINSANSATYARDLAQEILARNAGQSVLVVGHSNTVPDIVTALTGQPVPPITDAEYDHVFTIAVPASGAPRLKQQRYGRPGA